MFVVQIMILTGFDKNLNGIRSNYKQTVKDRISMVDGPTASIYSSIESLIKTI